MEVEEVAAKPQYFKHLYSFHAFFKSRYSNISDIVAKKCWISNGIDRLFL